MSDNTEIMLAELNRIWEKYGYQETWDVIKKVGEAVRYHQSPDEKDLIIHGLQEGAENWKSEYDNCRAILEELVWLKYEKDHKGKTDQYLKRQPLAWERAVEFLKKYQHGYE